MTTLAQVSEVDITSLAYADDAARTFTQVSPSNPFPVTSVPASALYQVTAATAATAGTGYAPGDTIRIAGGSTASPAVLTATHTKVITATVVSGGTGGTPGAVTVTGTTGTGTKFQATGTISAGGVLTGALTVTVAGDYTVNPTDITAEPVTGGSLTGATVLLTIGILTLSVTSAGAYVVVPTNPASQSSTSGSGTGGTYTLTTSQGLSNVMTIASGGVAAGAYAAGSLAAGAGVDGWDLTQGAKADAAWTSGSGSEISLLKAIANAAISTNPVQEYRSDTYQNIVLAAPTTTVVKSGAGTLSRIVFNKAVATGTITIYDNTAASGTLIGTITVPANPQLGTLVYDCAFATGLTIVTATAAQDITVVYR